MASMERRGRDGIAREMAPELNSLLSTVTPLVEKAKGRNSLDVDASFPECDRDEAGRKKWERLWLETPEAIVLEEGEIRAGVALAVERGHPYGLPSFYPYIYH